MLVNLELHCLNTYGIYSKNPNTYPAGWPHVQTLEGEGVKKSLKEQIREFDNLRNIRTFSWNFDGIIQIWRVQILASFRSFLEYTSILDK